LAQPLITHCPAWQLDPAMHLFPQLPQLFISDCRLYPSSIIPLQLSSFPLHVSFVGVFALHVPYAPLLHVCVPVHVPYALLVAQFFVVLFMHPVHAPFTHDCPDWQVTPQLPQLFISFGAAS
jgi:hypothetical protein